MVQVVSVVTSKVFFLYGKELAENDFENKRFLGLPFHTGNHFVLRVADTKRRIF